MKSGAYKSFRPWFSYFFYEQNTPIAKLKRAHANNEYIEKFWFADSKQQHKDKYYEDKSTKVEVMEVFGF